MENLPWALVATRTLALDSGTASALFIVAAARSNSGVATLHIKPVQTLDAPELALYLTLRHIDEHERAGGPVAPNARVIKRLLARWFTVESALLTPAWLEKPKPVLRATGS